MASYGLAHKGRQKSVQQPAMEAHAFRPALRHAQQIVASTHYIGLRCVRHVARDR